MTSTTLRDIEDFPDVGEMMASKYLAAVDIDGAGELVTITSVKSGTETFEAGTRSISTAICLTPSETAMMRFVNRDSCLLSHTQRGMSGKLRPCFV